MSAEEVLRHERMADLVREAHTPDAPAPINHGPNARVCTGWDCLRVWTPGTYDIRQLGASAGDYRPVPVCPHCGGVLVEVASSVGRALAG